MIKDRPIFPDDPEFYDEDVWDCVNTADREHEEQLEAIKRRYPFYNYSNVTKDSDLDSVRFRAALDDLLFFF